MFEQTRSYVAGSNSSRFAAAARSAEPADRESTPVRPSTTCSTKPPTGVEITGIPAPNAAAATPDWLASPGWPVAQSGWRVAGAGDVNGDGKDDVVVGAPAHTNDEVGEGAVYLHLGDGSGLQDPLPTTDCNR